MLAIKFVKWWVDCIFHLFCHVWEAGSFLAPLVTFFTPVCERGGYMRNGPCLTQIFGYPFLRGWKGGRAMPGLGSRDRHHGESASFLSLSKVFFFLLVKTPLFTVTDTSNHSTGFEKQSFLDSRSIFLSNFWRNNVIFRDLFPCDCFSFSVSQYICQSILF